MATIRSKMKLVEVTSFAWGTSTKRLKFNSQYDSSIPEDQRFQKAMPVASAEYLVDNPDALSQFELGKDYYVDFTPVEAEVATE